MVPFNGPIFVIRQFFAKMKLLAIILFIASTSAQFSNQLPLHLLSQPVAATYNIPTEVPTFASTISNEVQPNLVASTPRPDFELNNAFPSSTVAPNADLNQNFYVSTTSDGLTVPYGDLQSRYSLGSSYPIYNQGIDFVQNEDDSEVVEGITSGGTVSDSFGFGDVQDQEQNVEIITNVYSFKAPEEQEYIAPRIRFLQPQRKNLNVIYIKAPVPPSLRTVKVVAPEAVQDKTVVFVLAKKPELNQEILVEHTPSKPQQPEVHFLKYNSEADAREQISRTQKKLNVRNGQVTTEANLPSSLLGENSSGLNQFRGDVVALNNAQLAYSTPLPLNFGGQNLLSSAQVPLNFGGQSLVSSTQVPLNFEGQNLVSSTQVPLNFEGQSLVSSTQVPLNFEGQSLVSSTQVPLNFEGQSLVSSTQVPLNFDGQNLVSSTPGYDLGVSFSSSTENPIFAGDFKRKK